MPDRAAEVNLLRDRNDAHSTLAPVGEYVDTFLEASGQPVELPNNNCRNLSCKDVSLQSLKGFTLKGCSALPVLKPLHSFLPVTLEPRFEFRALAVGLLAFRRRYADIPAFECSVIHSLEISVPSGVLKVTNEVT